MTELVTTTRHFGTAPIRQVTVDDTELWALADICAALGLSHSCSARIPAANKRSCRIATNGGPQQLTFVDLEGFELAVIRSNKPLAKTMRAWIHEHKPHATKEDTMNTDITTFDFHGNQVRVITDAQNEPWFIGNDVAEVLGYANTRDALNKHVEDEDKNTVAIRDGIGNPYQTIINESGLYSLILSSKLPAAKEFKRWVTSEVLPSIRKHGGYLAGQEHMSPEEMVAASMRYLESKIAEQKRQLDAQKPKVALANAISNSTSTILIGELAKILTQNGAHNLGTRRLFERLRADGYLCRQHGEMWNLPTQRAMDMGLFEVLKRPVAMPDGSVRVTRTTKVTGKGQEYFIDRYITKEA